jgi:hypothetical protein
VTFRQISTVALDGVSADLQMKYGWHTEATGSIETLDRSPVAPQVAGEATLRMTNKGTGANSGQVGDQAVAPQGGQRPTTARNSQTRTSHDWQAISASLLTANRNKRVALPTRHAPALATRLFLVVDKGHRSHPI